MVINKKMVPQDGSGGVPDGVAEGVVATTTSDGNPPPVRPDQAVVSSGGVIQLNRPSIVKTIGRVAPRTRSGFNGGGGTRGGMMGMNNNNNNRRPFVRPMAPRPSNPIQGQGFDGVVDDRVLPDAGLPTEFLEGVLDITSEGYGYLRPDFVPGPKDVYISSSQIRRFGLRPGDMVGGQARGPKENERYWGLLKVETVNEEKAVESYPVGTEKVVERPTFDSLTAIFPDEQVRLESEGGPLSARMIDLIAPIGKGQRGLIVSPPKAGKTTIIKEIANGVTKNYPKMHLMVVLIGERPEEVTDMARNVQGEVVASHFDEPPLNQVRVGELALERAKRLAEMGKDVFVLLDSITRMARAYNMGMPNSGRTLSGGFDPAALYPAKQFFGAARNFENGGSLTIIGSCLVDTGSRMDDLIYEEFKGTGNMELHLDRRLADRRVFPAIDMVRSGTRREDALLGERYQKAVMLRRLAGMLNDEERTMLILDKMSKSKNNDEFLESLKGKS